MKLFKKLLYVSIATTALSALLAGCGSGSNSSTESSSDSKDVEVEKLIVATDATFAPFDYMDDKGNIVGIDVDVVNAIAEKAGFEVEIKNLGWEPLFAAVQNGEADFAANAITITDERKETYDFTDPYFVANQLILIPEDSTVTKFADLKDKKVGVQINTTGHEAVKGLQGNSSKNILAAETLPLAIEELLNGGIDAIVSDNAVILEYQKNNPDVKLKVVEDASFEKEYYGIMVQKGNKELLDQLNKAIKELKDSGELEKLTGAKVE